MKTFAFIRKIVHNYQNPHQNYHYCGYLKFNIMKTRKHFIRKYELLARCIQTNLELFILQ